MSARCLAIGLTAALLATHVVAAPREAERPAVQTERPSKPTGPIAVDHRLEGVPRLGIPLAISLTARTAGGAALTLEATASRPEALLVETPVLARVEAGRFEWTLTVVPLAFDAGFVNIVVGGEIDGVDQARSVAIPLRVAAEPAAGARIPDASETLIALPVDENR